jgi:PilZ domain-containing protein
MAGGSLAATANLASKVAARVAAVDVDSSAFAILHDCFRQYSIEIATLSGSINERLRREKFDACVLDLKPAMLTIVEAARSSPLNRRMVIYGISHAPGDAVPFIKYGINAVLEWPFDRQTAHKMIRSTQSLIIHEFRRYVRVPVTTEVAVRVDGQKMTALSEEISAGGMSIRVPQTLVPASPMLLSFILPSNNKVTITATVCWAREQENLVGVRFGPADERRLQVRSWIDQYLKSA